MKQGDLIVELNETYQGKVIFDYDFAEGTTSGAEYMVNSHENGSQGQTSS